MPPVIARNSAVRVGPHAGQAADEGRDDAGVDVGDLVAGGEHLLGDGAHDVGGGGFAGHGDLLSPPDPRRPPNRRLPGRDAERRLSLTHMGRHVDLDAIGETLFTPLYAKANAALVPEAGFDDPLAATLWERTGHDRTRVLTDRSNVAGSVYRSLAIDDATVRFASQHPTGQVVSAGIGLCTRHARLADRAPATIGWIGVDTAEVVEVRRSLLGPDDPVALVAASIAEPSWADGLDATRPTLVIAEGALMYLDPAGLASFLGVVRDRFGPGSEVLGDYFHPRIASSDRHPIVKATGARFLSGARNGRALAELVPGYLLVAEYPVMERISTAQRLAARAFTHLSRGGRLYAVVHMRVG
jgi:O-methyltransferase